MSGNLRQYLLEIAELLRMVGLACQVFHETLHAFHAVAVQGFEDSQGGKEKRAGSAGGIEDRDLLDGLPEGTEQLGAFTVDNDVAGELPDIQIQRYQIVDGADLSCHELPAKLQAAGAAGDVLAPRLGGQCIRVAGGLVPTLAPGDVLDARLDIHGQRNDVALPVDDAMAYGRVDVAVGVVAEQAPEKTAGLEGDGAFLLGGVEEVRDNGVLADVLGDVFLGVVGPHLLLVDIFLEDVADDVRVDLVVGAKGPFVEVPGVLIEEVEQLFEGLVGDVDIGVAFFKLMDLEKAAVEIGDLAEEFCQVGVELALIGGFAKAVVEEAEQEVAVKRLKLVLALRLADHLETVAQVVHIAVEKSLFLDEVHEHQAVEHEGRVPLEIGVALDALDELEKNRMLGLEAVVKLPGDFIHIESGASAAGDVHDGDLFLLIETDGNAVQALDERVAGLGDGKAVIAACQGFARFTADPVPHLPARGLIGIDHKVFVDGFRDPLVDLQPGCAVRG